MSRKPFMWNRNNPYQYADPSGYIWTLIDDDRALRAAIEKLLKKSETFNKSYQAAQQSELVFTIKVVPAADVRHTGLPGHENDGISRTQVVLDKNGDVGGAAVSIAAGLTGDNLLGGVGEEVFNAGRIGSDYAGFLSDFRTFDANTKNMAEVKGHAAQAKILAEVNAKKK
jgi:hypothetical protein